MTSGAVLLLFALAVAVSGLACTDDALTFAPDTLSPAMVGQPYEARLTISGNRTPVGSMSLESGALPPGLALDYAQIQSFATISGTPRQAGMFRFTIAAWCMGTNQPGQTGRRDYELTVR